MRGFDIPREQLEAGREAWEDRLKKEQRATPDLCKSRGFHRTNGGGLCRDCGAKTPGRIGNHLS